MGSLVQNYRQFPKQIKFIVWNEACERFSFYGMRSILVVFMVSYMAIPKEDAMSYYHIFGAAAYLLPLGGAILADRYFGKYNTIFYLSLIYCLGNFALAFFQNAFGLFLGLALIAIGSGGIKPCVSAYVGDQFDDTKQHLLQKVFDLFYWSINLGSTFASLLIPVILVTYGPGIAFAIPGVLMLIATGIFWSGRHQYVNLPPSREAEKTGFVPILVYAIKNRKDKPPGGSLLDAARSRFSAADIQAAKSVFSIIKVFATVSVFWALFDQSGSSWVLQAQQMDPNAFGFHWEASQMQAFNSVLVLVLIPIFSSMIYPGIEGLGVRVTPLRRMSVGMVLAAFSFLVVGLLQAQLDAGNKISIGWQLVPYFIITCSEVMVSITGLEFAYTEAPKSMKSTIMSFWLITVFIGNLLAASIAKMNVFQGAGFFYFFAGLMLAVSGVFVFNAMRYKRADDGAATNTVLATI